MVSSALFGAIGRVRGVGRSRKGNLLRNDEDRVCARSAQPLRVSVDGSSSGARSVGRHGCTAAKDVAKPVKENAAGLGCSLRDMTEPEEAVDQPVVLYVLHLDTHIA